LRRLFERLQQGVEGRPGQHVNLVDDVDLVARDERTVAGVLDDLANVFDARVGSRVHFDDVGMPAFHDLAAVPAELGWIDRQLDRRTTDTVFLEIEGAGNDAGRGGFANTAYAGQHIPLRDAAMLESIAQ